MFIVVLLISRLMLMIYFVVTVVLYVKTEKRIKQEETNEAV